MPRNRRFVSKLEYKHRKMFKTNGRSVVNLSNYRLKFHEFAILSLGMSISHTPPYIKTSKNLTQKESEALLSLQNNADIIVKHTDRGKTVVVMDKRWYKEECYRQLGDQSVYTKLSNNTTSQIVEELNQLLDSVKESIPMSVYYYNSISKARTPIFFVIPNIGEPDNPGRPLVSTNWGPTEKLSCTVDISLGKLARRCTSYIQNTSDFLRKLKGLSPLPPGIFLASADVVSLYTSIPHEEGIDVVRKALDTSNIEITFPKSVLLKFLQFVVTHSVFEFDDNYFQQIKGIPLGTKCARNFAGLFMDDLERSILDVAPLKPLVWWRFADHVFYIWPHEEETLVQFNTFVNQFHPDIKFTFTHSKDKVQFLDTSVELEDGKLTASTCTKPTDAVPDASDTTED